MIKKFKKVIYLCKKCFLIYQHEGFVFLIRLVVCKIRKKQFLDKSFQSVGSKLFKNYQRKKFKKGDRLNIAYLVESYLCCGGIRIIFEHANRLAERGHKIYLINIFNTHSANWFDLNDNIVLVNFFDYKKWINDIDLIVATYHKTIRYILSLPKTLRKFYFVQSDERKFYNKICIDYFEAEESYKIPGVSFFTEAKWIQRWLKSEFDKDAELILNKLNFNHFFPDKTIRSDKTVVLVEGNVDVKHKGVFDAIEALKDVNCEKWLLTNSVSGERLKDSFDKIWVMPPQSTVRQVISSADIFVKPSYFEGSPLPHMEAMACGTALITSRHLGALEYCVDGFNSLMFEPGDVLALRNLIIKLIEDNQLRSRLVENGLKYARENFQWDESMDKLENMFWRSANFNKEQTSEKEFIFNVKNRYRMFNLY